MLKMPFNLQTQLDNLIQSNYKCEFREKHNLNSIDSTNNDSPTHTIDIIRQVLKEDTDSQGTSNEPSRF